MPAEAKTFRNKSRSSGRYSWSFETGAAGQKNAALSAISLIEEGCDCLISWGVAGALDPQLNVGDLIITSSVINEESRYFKFDPSSINELTKALTSLDPQVGTLIYSAKEPVLLAVEKQKLHRKNRADIVDMESAAIAKIAYDAKIDFIAIRCIVDRADCDIPLIATHALKDNGKVDFFQLIVSLVQKPRQFIPLIRLGFNYNSALRRLKKAADLLQ